MLTSLQIQQLKNEGYSEREIAEAVNEVEREKNLKGAYNQAKNQNTMGTSLQTPFSYNPNDNMIKWQLEVNEILERAEHILREDKIEVNNGRVDWISNDSDERILNDNGVKEFMRILSMYVNRNTILGNYTAEEVYDKVFDFGDRLNTLFFNKYENLLYDVPLEKIFNKLYGLDMRDYAKDFIELNYLKNFKTVFSCQGATKKGDIIELHFKVGDAYVVQIATNKMIELVKNYTYNQFLTSNNPLLLQAMIERNKIMGYKRKNFEMLWGTMVDTVHSAYSRAIGAGERISLREARQLTQMENINPTGNININAGGNQMPKTRSIFNPMRYFVSKYKN